MLTNKITVNSSFKLTVKYTKKKMENFNFSPVTSNKTPQNNSNSTPQSSTFSNLFQDSSALNSALHLNFPSPISSLSLPSALLGNFILPSPSILSQNYTPIVPKTSEKRTTTTTITNVPQQDFSRPVPQLKLPGNSISNFKFF